MVLRARRSVASENRRGRGESGAALIELAMFAPFFIFMVMGMMEFGLMWRDSIRSSARVASSLRSMRTGFDVMQSAAVRSNSS